MVEPTEDLIPAEIQAAIEAKDWVRLATLRSHWPEPLLSAPACMKMLEVLEKKDWILFFRALPQDHQVELVAHLDPDTADQLLIQLNDSEARQILEDLEPDDRSALLHELPGPLAVRLLSLLDPAEARAAVAYWGYPEDSVGRLMTPHFVKIKAHWTCEQALEHIRRHGQEIEYLQTVFVTGRGGILVDDLTLQQLVLARPETLVEELMDGVFLALATHDDRQKAVELMRTYGQLALPVVDSRGYLVGIVTFDDVLEVAVEEDTEDFQKAAAIKPLEEEYWHASLPKQYRHRVGWLIGLVLVNLLSSSVVAFFEELLAANVVLAFFLPLLADTGGNAGTQASTLLLRALCTRDVESHDMLRVVAKEFVVSLIMGLLLGLGGFVLGWVRGGQAVGLVVLATMLSVVVASNLVGALLPFVLTLFRQDPAVASGPLVTTIMDVLGLALYFSWAQIFLG